MGIFFMTPYEIDFVEKKKIFFESVINTTRAEESINQFGNVRSNFVQHHK